MFICPVCGNNSYVAEDTSKFKCVGCSVIFSDPVKFGNATKKREQNKKFNSEQPYIYPSDVGGVVSTPIKLRRS